MDGFTRIIQQFVDGRLSTPTFLEALDVEKTRTMALTRRWWKSPPSFEACWNDLGGFDEVVYEHRVKDAFYEAYSRSMHRALEPVLKRRVTETPAIHAMLKEIRGYLFSDVYDRALAAETIEEIYFLLGDDLTHWLVVYLVSYLKPSTKAGGKPR